MDGFRFDYVNHFGQDLSVEVDLRARAVAGPGAKELLRCIENWERAVAKNPHEHWLFGVTRDSVWIEHPWRSARDMVAFMQDRSWSDLMLWPDELIALVPPTDSTPPPGPDVLFIVN
jgi:hypothetical protein